MEGELSKKTTPKYLPSFPSPRDFAKSHLNIQHYKKHTFFFNFIHSIQKSNWKADEAQTALF